MLAAFQEDAHTYGSPVLSALERLSASPPYMLELRSSFALAGYAGSYMPSWISQAQAKRRMGPSIVTASIEPGDHF